MDGLVAAGPLAADCVIDARIIQGRVRHLLEVRALQRVAAAFLEPRQAYADRACAVATIAIAANTTVPNQCFISRFPRVAIGQ